MHKACARACAHSTPRLHERLPLLHPLVEGALTLLVLWVSPRELGDACAQAVHARERDAVPGALLQLRREKNC